VAGVLGRSRLLRLQQVQDALDEGVLGGGFGEPRETVSQRHAGFEERPQPVVWTRERDRLNQGRAGALGVSLPFQGNGFEDRDLDQLTLKPALGGRLANRCQQVQRPLQPRGRAFPISTVPR
jgi:hypothetical protein